MTRSLRPDLAIAPATRADLGAILDWAEAEGWNPGLHDADPFLAQDPGGFLVGRLDGEPIASVSCVRYAGGFAFVGFYIVRPGFRGRGYGWTIWTAAMNRLRGDLVGLDGVVAQQDNYRASGFVLAHRNVRYEGRGSGAALAGAPLARGLVPVKDGDWPAVLAFDRRYFPADRDAFLARWVRQPGTTALVLERGGAIAGWGALRACRSGFKIGPLFADRADDAETLFDALRAVAPAGAPVFLDVPAPHAAAVALAERHGMTPMFETARMYTGPAPRAAVERSVGITSFELG